MPWLQHDRRCAAAWRWQRILYRLEGEGRLHARIEGTVKGTAKGIDFPMKRVSCDAPL